MSKSMASFHEALAFLSWRVKPISEGTLATSQCQGSCAACEEATNTRLLAKGLIPQQRLGLLQVWSEAMSGANSKHLTPMFVWPMKAPTAEDQLVSERKKDQATPPQKPGGQAS